MLVRLGFRQEAFALGALAGQFARTAHGLGLLASFALGRLFEMVATLHFAEETFTLHLLLERFQRLIDVVIADHDLNYLKLSIGVPAGTGGIGKRTSEMSKQPKTLPPGIRTPARRVIFPAPHGIP